MRMIAAFTKGKDIRFIGHLDLMRTLQRALRRSGLPLRYSNGFSPHILLTFAVPLSVGVVGLREWMDVPLSEEISPAAFRDGLNAVLPQTIRVGDCFPMGDKLPALMSLVGGARYRIEFEGFGEDAEAVYTRFAGQEEIIALRKTKSGERDCNIKKFVESTRIEKNDSKYTIHLCIRADSDGMLKPALWFKTFCAFLSREEPPYLAYREEILTADPDGRLVPMEALFS